MTVQAVRWILLCVVGRRTSEPRIARSEGGVKQPTSRGSYALREARLMYSSFRQVTLSNNLIW
jgi:hypothetical protein